MCCEKNAIKPLSPNSSSGYVQKVIVNDIIIKKAPYMHTLPRNFGRSLNPAYTGIKLLAMMACERDGREQVNVIMCGYMYNADRGI